LEAMPGLLVAIERTISENSNSKRCQDLFETVVRYALEEEDLIPSHAGRPILGLLDDVYLLHLVGYELRYELRRVSIRSVGGGLALLRSVLPVDVTRELSRMVEDLCAQRE